MSAKQTTAIGAHAINIASEIISSINLIPLSKILIVFDPNSYPYLVQKCVYMGYKIPLSASRRGDKDFI